MRQLRRLRETGVTGMPPGVRNPHGDSDILYLWFSSCGWDCISARTGGSRLQRNHNYH